MNEQSIPETPSTKMFCWLRMVVVVALATGMTGCAPPSARSHAGSRDHLAGWFKCSGNGMLIPVFKRNGTFYSVCRGLEVPLKECPDGLEWALTPSSMAGTQIGWDATAKTFFLAVRDQLASNNSDGRYGCGEREPMTRIEAPVGLLNAQARPPRSHDDFSGWYQPVWFPWVKIEIQKNGVRYFTREQEFHDVPGIWHVPAEPREITPLSHRLGFTFDQHGKQQLVFNDDLKRYEIILERAETNSSIIRMPLARIPPPDLTDAANAPRPTVGIGIPAWN